MKPSSLIVLVVAASGAWLLWRRRGAALPVRSATPATLPKGDAVARISLAAPAQPTDPRPPWKRGLLDTANLSRIS